MTKKRARSGALVIGGALAAAAAIYLGCQGAFEEVTGPDGETKAPACPGGTDQDGDGFGQGCPAGEDCDDADPGRNLGATEICDGKDNNCDGKTDEIDGCNASVVGAGDAPFPVDPSKDTNLTEVDGVKLDENGDLILGASLAQRGFIWVANTDDGKRGTISKVNTRTMKEVARYLTITCRSNPQATGCVDTEGRPITPEARHTPSRTAVDFNMDVWVANRCLHGCQPSATKIANAAADCIDRNGNGKIDTSADHDGDGRIALDCDGNGKPDTAKTSCSGGKKVEFLGDDDECILFTTNYGDPGDIARSICLAAGKATIGASSAWVGTYKRPENGRGPNQYHRLDGTNGKIVQTIDLPLEHHAYGCMADSRGLVWSTDIGHYETEVDGNLTYFQATPPYRVGKVLRGPDAANPWQDRKSRYRHYGISTDSDQHIWLGTIDSGWVLRYKPDRASFDAIHQGTWTRIDLPKGFESRGIAPDSRGKVWVAIEQGYVFRIEQSIPDGVHDMSGAKENQDYWRVSADEVIGVGVDIDLNIWAVGKSNNTASRIDVDDQGAVVAPSTGTTKQVRVGHRPYTYSDFTGFGLRNFVRPQGRWGYQHRPCPAGQKALFKQVVWNATTPPKTAVNLRTRSGDSDATFGAWSKIFESSPADIGPSSASPTEPNPAALLQVEFTLTSSDKTVTPILHDYSLVYDCIGSPD